LLATDNKNSVLAEIAGGKPNAIAYSAYGQPSAQQEVATGLGFNGELHEAHIGWYLLGNGYRAYNPVLMRFHSPDSLSPFGKGGLNAYMYCVGDPVNASDPTGHMPKGLLNFLKKTPGKTVTKTSSTSSLKSLIPANSPPAEKRALPPTPSAVSDLTTMRNSGAPLGQSTGENIYGTLPPGRRTWTPPPEPHLPRGMMTYTEMGQLQGAAGRDSTRASASASPPGPPVNRSIKPTNSATWNVPANLQGPSNAYANPVTRPLPAPEVELGNGLSIDSRGELIVDFQKFNWKVRGSK
jgi:RHS repeat-associated protein